MSKVSRLEMVLFPCCNKHIPNGHKMTPKEKEEAYKEHKKHCKLYKEWMLEKQIEKESD